jgi:uncharacterized membrane protein YkvA (DUF1232 family)
MPVALSTTELRRWAAAIKVDVVALWLSARDPRVPWLAKLVAGMIAAYALSPVDLIPDFIPVLGYLDDLIIVPFGILLAVRLIPADVMRELRTEAARRAKPMSRLGLVMVMSVWLLAAGVVLWMVWPHSGPVRPA